MKVKNKDIKIKQNMLNKNKGNNSAFTLVVGLLIIILISIISTYLNFRVDLTADKRYSVTEITKQTVKSLDDVAYFKVYLEGDLNNDYRKLKKAVQKKLNQYRSYNKNIQYKFIDLGSVKGKVPRDKAQELINKGLSPDYYYEEDNDTALYKELFAGAIISYKDKEMPVKFLVASDDKLEINYNQGALISYSIEKLELTLTQAIMSITDEKRKSIAFIQGHGERNDITNYNIRNTLGNYYNVYNVEIGGKINSVFYRNAIDSTRLERKFDCLVIAKPDSAFSNYDKYLIDQHIIRGGSVMWAIDELSAELDSLIYQSSMLSMQVPHQLDDMFYSYGVRINKDLVIDLNSALKIPAPAGNEGGTRQWALKEFMYFPLINPLKENNNIIVKGIGPVKTQFVSSIDTVGSSYIKKTVLLSSSNLSTVQKHPVNINLSSLQSPVDARLFSRMYIPTAVLTEAQFHSTFENRIVRGITDDPYFDFRTVGDSARQIFISDGDIMKNGVEYNAAKQGFPLPLGYDKRTNITYANKIFILNCFNYLMYDEDIIELRSREFKIRPLDSQKVKDNRTKIIFNNIAIPLLFLLIIALTFVLRRMIKYRKR